METSNNKTWLTRKEVKNIYGFSVPTLLKYERLRLFHAYQLGGRIYYIKEEIDDAFTPRISDDI